jgi:hypothetical protein
MTTQGYIFRHKKSGITLTVPSKVVLKDEEMPYDKIPMNKFERVHEKSKKVIDSLKHDKNDLKIVVIKMIIDEYENENGIVIDKDMTWDECKRVLVDYVKKQRVNDPEDITDVALSYRAYYVPNMDKVLDTREGKPYDVLPDGGYVYVSMFRRSEGWKPLAIAYMVCGRCGMQGKLKMCSTCKKAFYCSKECQQADWKEHKKMCKK